MAAFQLVLCLILTTLGPVGCQGDPSARARKFPQWLTGIIAVSVFLFLVLIVFVINRIWCERNQGNDLQMVTERKITENNEVMSNGTEGHYSTILQFRSNEHGNAYENAVEPEAVVVTTPM
ncbi:PDZK1-interacting protein 1 [Ambystoma mexicanum]|uniref:PDZK1-interacting protein 1 n=1 Tax=Ambystoma mexicanum TaxID=8296 RepID=UPI0037E88941